MDRILWCVLILGLTLSQTLAQLSYKFSPVYTSEREGMTSCTTPKYAQAATSGLGAPFSSNQIPTFIATPGSSLKLKQDRSMPEYIHVTIQHCIRHCQNQRDCIAVTYIPACNAPQRIAICSLLTNQPEKAIVETSGSTLGQSIVSNPTVDCGSYVTIVKLCDGKPNPVLTSLDETVGVDMSTWASWTPWTACCRISRNGQPVIRTRIKTCITSSQGNNCNTPAGFAEPRYTVHRDPHGQQVLTEQQSCDTSCVRSSREVLQNYCMLAVDENTNIQDECNCCHYYSCATVKWGQMISRPCPDTMYFDQATRQCMVASSQIQCYRPIVANIATSNFCEKNVDAMSISRYHDRNGQLRTCKANHIFWKSSCDCQPGPSMSIARRHYMSLIMCKGTNSDANRYAHLGAADPFPVSKYLQYDFLNTNPVCKFTGDSGIKIKRLSGVGNVLNPAILFWFKDIGVATETPQVLISNGEPYNVLFGEMPPSVKFALVGNRLIFESVNMASNITFPTAIAKNHWYCVAAVFDHGVRYNYGVNKRLTLRLYMKSEIGPAPQQINYDAAVSSNNVYYSHDMKVAFSTYQAYTRILPGTHWFTGEMDSLTFTRDVVLTANNVAEFCATRPDQY